MKLKNLGQIAILSAVLGQAMPTVEQSKNHTIEVTGTQSATNSSVNTVYNSPNELTDGFFSEIESQYTQSIENIQKKYPQLIKLAETHKPEILKDPKILRAGIPGDIWNIVKGFFDTLGWDGTIALLIALVLAGIIGFGTTVKYIGRKGVRSVEYIAGKRPPEERGKVIDITRFPQTNMILNEITPNGDMALHNLSHRSRQMLEEHRRFLKDIFKYLMYQDAEEGVSTFKQAMQYFYLKLKLGELENLPQSPQNDLEITNLTNEAINLQQSILDNEIRVTSIVHKGLKEIPAILQRSGAVPQAAIDHVVKRDIHLPDTIPNFNSPIRQLRILELKALLFQGERQRAEAIVANGDQQNVQEIQTLRLALTTLDFIEAIQQRIDTIKNDRTFAGDLIHRAEGRLLPATLTRRRFVKVAAGSAATYSGIKLLADFFTSEENTDKPQEPRDPEDIPPLDPIPLPDDEEPDPLPLPGDEPQPLPEEPQPLDEFKNNPEEGKRYENGRILE